MNLSAILGFGNSLETINSIESSIALPHSDGVFATDCCSIAVARDAHKLQPEAIGI